MVDATESGLQKILDAIKNEEIVVKFLEKVGVIFSKLINLSSTARSSTIICHLTLMRSAFALCVEVLERPPFQVRAHVRLAPYRRDNTAASTDIEFSTR